MTVALFGIPSLHSIIQAIANGFFSALAGALVPGWLRHGTVATIQHLVALPDPASWPHVGRLQGDATFLAAMLLPATLALGAVRYWAVGLTGAAHPATAITRSATVTGVLVVYRWGVEQTVAATNTLTHGVLELPAVGGGLQRIIGVLFGGALVTGTGGVFGAFLVILGVVFAAGLFAAQVLVTVILAVLIVTGPPLIAISAIPELSHLARNWAYALLGVALVPVGWTVLFATAGALCLDATSFTGAGGGLPGHVAAAFAGLITFVLAVRLPLTAVGELRNLFHAPAGGVGTVGAGAGRAPGVQQVRAAHARLRAVGLQGVPSLGRSVGRAAGALGAPAGGLIGAAVRRSASASRRAVPRGRSDGTHSSGASTGPGRFASARRILADAPAQAAAAVAAGSPRARPANTGGPGDSGRAPTGRPGPTTRENRPSAGGSRPGAAATARTGPSPRSPGGPAPKRAGPTGTPSRPGPARPARATPAAARPAVGQPDAEPGRRPEHGETPSPTPRRRSVRPESAGRAAGNPPGRAPRDMPGTPRPQPRSKQPRKGRA